MEKICKNCKEKKDIREFYPSGMYFFSECKICTKKRVAKWQKNNPEKSRKKAREEFRRRFKVKPENYRIV